MTTSSIASHISPFKEFLQPHVDSIFTPLTNMATALISLLHALQASFGAYTLYLSSISIRNLQKYEESSKKAAKYSNIAEQQLHKTRTTQASGALSVLHAFLLRVHQLTIPGPVLLP